MLLKVATVNDTSWQVGFVYIVFGYNFNMSKGVSHSFAVKNFLGQMSDTSGVFRDMKLSKLQLQLAHTKITPFMLPVI